MVRDLPARVAAAGRHRVTHHRASPRVTVATIHAAVGAPLLGLRVVELFPPTIDSPSRAKQSVHSHDSRQHTLSLCLSVRHYNQTTHLPLIPSFLPTNPTNPLPPRHLSLQKQQKIPLSQHLSFSHSPVPISLDSTWQHQVRPIRSDPIRSDQTMSVTCGVECVVCITCGRWAWKRCTHIGSSDSATWPPAAAADFSPIPRACRLILAVYESDLSHPKFSTPGGYRLNPNNLVKRVTYDQTLGRSPPYIVYLDHDHKEIVLAIRGLNLAKETDYKLLLDNKLGMQMFDGGYVHRGLLKSATWLLEEESPTLRRLWRETGGDYSFVFAGHSLGSGVAALLAVVVVNHREELGGVPRSKVRCYAVAPARCMSLNLAVKYADVISSVVLQDDFLPRTATPLEDIFKSIFWCGRFPPEVRTAIPVDGRFEHIVLSCNATSDHAILWIAREAEKALDRMMESSEVITTAPMVQKLERMQTLEKEHKDAMERAVSLNVPHVVTIVRQLENADADAAPPPDHEKEPSLTKSKSSDSRTNWETLVEKLFDRTDSGKLELKKDKALSDK
ncbi:hypothetical protein Syun_022560 [Stephania yunnanensis]|uniref:Fungal lipase-like domain-containing protein n=1 Tax=Stephania yunnanensis TaxID=152371 RepID=A0AAP0F7Y4_9MAGN